MSTLAALAFEMLEKGLRGIFNVGSRAGMSKRDFAHSVAARLGLSTAAAKDGDSAAIPGRAARPRDLRMDVGRVEHALRRPMPSCQHEIDKL